MGPGLLISRATHHIIAEIQQTCFFILYCCIPLKKNCFHTKTLNTFLFIIFHCSLTTLYTIAVSWEQCLMPQHIHFHSSPGYICGILLKQQPYIWENQQIYIPDSWAASTIPNHFSHSFKAAQIKDEWFWRKFECLYQGSWVPPPMRSPLSLQYAQNIPKNMPWSKRAMNCRITTETGYPPLMDQAQFTGTDWQQNSELGKAINVWTGKQVLGWTPRSRFFFGTVLPKDPKGVWSCVNGRNIGLCWKTAWDPLDQRSSHYGFALNIS